MIGSTHTRRVAELEARLVRLESFYAQFLQQYQGHLRREAELLAEQGRLLDQILAQVRVLRTGPGDAQEPSEGG